MTIDAELTLEDALSDPLILMLMRADGVDPEDLRAVWTKFGAAPRVDAGAGGHAPERIQPEPTPTTTATPQALRHLITDCVRAEAARAPAHARQTKTGSRQW